MPTIMPTMKNGFNLKTVNDMKILSVDNRQKIATESIGDVSFGRVRSVANELRVPNWKNAYKVLMVAVTTTCVWLIYRKYHVSPIN
jgi:hypothetical protein